MIGTNRKEVNKCSRVGGVLAKQDKKPKSPGIVGQEHVPFMRLKRVGKAGRGRGGGSRSTTNTADADTTESATSQSVAALKLTKVGNGFTTGTQESLFTAASQCVTDMAVHGEEKAEMMEEAALARRESTLCVGVDDNAVIWTCDHCWIPPL